jgi:hypothetical protein
MSLRYESLIFQLMGHHEGITACLVTDSEMQYNSILQGHITKHQYH